MNETVLKSLVITTFPAGVGQSIPEPERATATDWLRDFWTASHVNMLDLERKVNANPRYLKAQGLKREGWFLRRWIARGRGQSGDDLMAVYRLVFAKGASELEMSEAANWKMEVAAQLGRASTLRQRAWFLRQLNSIE